MDEDNEYAVSCASIDGYNDALDDAIKICKEFEKSWEDTAAHKMNGSGEWYYAEGMKRAYQEAGQKISDLRKSL